jgi:hypothetical protein
VHPAYKLLPVLAVIWRVGSINFRKRLFYSNSAITFAARNFIPQGKREFQFEFRKIQKPKINYEAIQF